jgi:hypothetical protein
MLDLLSKRSRPELKPATCSKKMEMLGNFVVPEALRVISPLHPVGMHLSGVHLTGMRLL